MFAVFKEREGEMSARRVVAEIVGAALAGARMRVGGARLLHPAAFATLGAAAVATMFALRQASLTRQPARLEFSAHDPAGVFTLTVIDGVPFAATIDNVPLSTSRIVAKADSIQLIGADGRVAIAVAFDEREGRITWAAREQAR